MPEADPPLVEKGVVCVLIQHHKITKEHVLEVISAVCDSGLVSPGAADKYLQNFACFETQRERIEADFANVWVASLNGDLLSAPTLQELLDTIKGRVNQDRAYIEFVGVSA